MPLTRRLVAAATLLALAPVVYAAPSDAAVANDAFAGAVVLTGPTASATADSTGAGTEAGEPSATSTSGATLWYRWTAPASGTYVVTTEGSSYDTTLGVYTGGALTSLAKVASSDDTFDVTSEVGLHATGGTTYFIQAGGAAGATGTLHLTVTPAQITGTITVAPGGDPTLACAAVATSGSSTALASGCADSTGFYAIGGVPRGGYDFVFDYDNTDQFNPNQPSGFEFLPTTGCTRSGRDASFVTHTASTWVTTTCTLTAGCISAQATRDAALAKFGTDSALKTAALKQLAAVQLAAKKARKQAAKHGARAYRRTVRRTQRLIAQARAAVASAQAVDQADSTAASTAGQQAATACSPVHA